MHAIHMTMDPATGVVTVQGRSGRIYTDEEFYAAQEAVDSGQVSSHPLLDDVDMGGTDRAPSLLEQLMHDCPDCRADMARGVQPLVIKVAHRSRNQRKRDRRRRS
jgi:hypothetical protein